MTQSFDAVVIGGGVAGSMCAARLAYAGLEVCLLESHLLGSGATTSNHGILHSGALYALLHPEVVADCRQAQAAYRSSFPEALIPAPPSWYVATPDTLASYLHAWANSQIIAEPVEPDRVQELLPRPDGIAAAAVSEVFIDTRTLLLSLAHRGTTLGVDYAIGTTVESVILDNGRVSGVQTASGTIRARHVVLCAGIDTFRLLTTVGSRAAESLASRLEMMLVAPGQLNHPVIGLEFGWPVVVPTIADGTLLASRYGGVQPTIRDRGRWTIPVREAQALTTELDGLFAPGLLDASSAAAWVCSKTEYIAVGSDQWNTSPNYAVLDHGRRENITGLWTVLPGKMTLAPHASRALTAQLAGHHQPLDFPAINLPVPAGTEALVASSPWATHLEITAP